MSYSKIAVGAVVVVSAFIGFGDRVLPEAVGQHSVAIRGHLIGMFPTINPKNNNAKTEKAIENLGQ